MNKFEQRKKSVLSKKDKSNIGSWDKKISSLCEKINSLEHYYTTSSCSGRVVFIIDQDKKSSNLFLAESHEKISIAWMNKNLEKIKGQETKFKCEPPIIHIACKDLDSAKDFLEKAKKSGFKHSGIHSLEKTIILEINGSDRLEFPLSNKEKILVESEFIQKIIDQSNKKLEKSWEMIKKLENSL